MKTLGTYLLIFGIGTFVLHMFGLQFKVMRIFGGSQTTAAIIFAAVGAILWFVGRRQEA